MRNVFKGAAIALVVLLGVAFGGLGETRADSAPAKPKEEPKADAKKLDLPWTLDECKKAWKKGMSMKLKATSKSGDKEEVSFTLEEITEITEKGYKHKTTNMDAEGKVKGEPTEQEQAWEDYFKGMDFTDKDTTVTEETIKVGAGEYDCKVYTQVKDENGSKSTGKCYFVKNKPGYIAKYSMEGAYGEMKFSYTMELVEVKE